MAGLVSTQVAKSTHIISCGKYATSKGVIRNRWKCAHCNYYFIRRDISFNLPYPKHIIIKAIRMYKTNKGYINKYDNLKKLTYSSREIEARTGIPANTILTKVKQYEKI